MLAISDLTTVHGGQPSWRHDTGCHPGMFRTGVAAVAGAPRLMLAATEVENALAAVHYALARGAPTSVGRWVRRSRCTVRGRGAGGPRARFAAAPLKLP